jgi:hypothetical protein
VVKELPKVIVKEGKDLALTVKKPDESEVVALTEELLQQ